METAVYIHIPFCRSKCVYCDFLSVPCQTEAAVDTYLQALEQEIKIRGRELMQEGIMVTTLYIGGGTPSILSAAALTHLLSACRQYLPLMSPEWTIEANPDTLTEEKIQILADSGINRISLGVQDLSDHRLALLGRLHNADQAKQAFMMCKDSFRSVSLDIMAALPEQTTAELMETLATIVTWKPQHVSVYGLKVEDDTPLQKQVRAGLHQLPDEDIALEMFLQSQKYLVMQGYEHYEIANFAQPGYRSQHNQVYWRNLPYLGLGLGAHSLWRKVRLVNTRSIETYQLQLALGQLPVEERNPVSLQQEMEDSMMLGLRLLGGVLFQSFYERFARDLREVFAPQIARLLMLQVIECDDAAVRLTSIGLPVANTIFAEFLG